MNNNNKISIRAYAKLNLLLDIVGKRDDGYHLMKMIMTQIDLCDNITMTVIKTKEPFYISVECVSDNKRLSKLPPQKNIVYKSAAAFLKATNINARVFIKLLKTIPSQAGMGGGSADGAAVIKGLNTIFNTRLSLDEMIKIGVSVSADIPFCLCGGTALVEGIGEKITPIKTSLDCFFVVIKPKCSVSTRSAFESFEKHANDFLSPDFEAAIKAIEENDIIKLSGYFANAFETSELNGEIKQAKAFLKEAGGIAPTMTGSGSAVFATCDDESKAKSILKKCLDGGFQAYLCRPIVR